MFFQITKLFVLLSLLNLFVSNLQSQGKTRSDTSTLVSTTDTIPQVPENQFYYANNKRFTILGDRPNLTTKIKPIPSLALGSVLVGIFVVQHELQQNTIWKRTGPFNIQEDGQWTYYIDKGGHFYGTYMSSYFITELLMTSGFSWDMATILGSTLGLCYTGYVEILDGYSLDFGFSPSDFYADVIGAGFHIAQHYVPFLQNFTPKFGYVKPSWLGELNRKPSDTFIDDYSSQTFWMSLNVHNMLPSDIKKYWPDWLELSFGYAVYSLCDPTNYKGYNCDPNRSFPISNYGWGNRKFLIALDYNVPKLIPDTWNFPNWIRQGLNHVRLPSPVLEIGEVTKFYLLYPFPIKIGNFRI